VPISKTNHVSLIEIPKKQRKSTFIYRFSTILVAGIVIFTSAGAGAIAAADSTDTTLKLRIMETTDIHTSIVNYDYYKDSPTDEYGLVRTATLVKQARAEVKNTMLIDNGDLIQGNPLGEYAAKVKPLKAGETHPVYKVMDLMKYDVSAVGNHEFNFGLDFMENSMKSANFPYVAQIYM
jgi:2',3'-cyclic-nucleotide 2'-phosphodiesterase/3'-nucleotidase